MGLLENNLDTTNEGILASDVNSFQAMGANVNLNFNVDLNKIFEGLINGDRERGAFVKSLLDTIASATNGAANIMIFNRQQDCDFNPDYRRAIYAEKDYKGILYGAWAFCGGERFVNKGDGGWINWGFYGDWDRDGNTVQFHNRDSCVKE
jgi:hypothetical protein